MSDFKSLNLLPLILEALESKGYNTPTPIQLQSIPHLLEGRDLLGIAQTGTGKTAAFSLPILNLLASNPVAMKPKSMRALILTPTRELASQIADNIKLYGKSLRIKHTVIFGGVGENPQITAMARGVEIVVATPGRLIDLTEQGFIKYDQLEVLVLDEADRMLDMGFIHDIRRIIKLLPHDRQNLLFSATMPRDIADLAHSILRDPVRVEVTPQSTTVEKISQRVCFVERSHKTALLKHILEEEKVSAALVFCRMKHGANKVEEYLQKQGIKAAAIHGNKTQAARERALKQFRDGQVQVLVATDIAARGIDIPSVSHVFNFDIPQEPESYVHRIGRTARAGRDGVAISFCDSLERGMLKAVEKAIKKSIAVDENHPFHGVAGVETSRKISSGKQNNANDRSNKNKHSEANSSSKSLKIVGNRIFSARNSASTKIDAKDAKDIKDNFGRNSSREGRHSKFSDKERGFDLSTKSSDSSKSSRFDRNKKSHSRDKYQGQPVHKRGQKPKSKGWGFASDKQNSHEARKSGGAIKSRLGKIVKWFSDKKR